MGLRVWDLGLRALGLRVWGFGFGAEGSGLAVERLKFTVGFGV